MEDPKKLRELYLFRMVPQEHLLELLSMALPVQLRAGHIVFKQGDAADVALLVIEGRLVASVEAQGDKKEVGDIRPGEVTGEAALFAPNGVRNATVTAATDSTCLLVSQELLEKGAANQAVIALEKHMLGTLARRIRSTNTSVQKAWKASLPSPAPQKLSLRDRLKTLFGGVA